MKATKLIYYPVLSYQNISLYRNHKLFLAAKSSSRNDGVNILLIMLTYLFTCMFTDIFTSRELTQTHVFNMLEYMFTCKVMYITTFVLHKNGTKNCT